MGPHIAEQDIAFLHAFPDVAHDALGFHGISAVIFVCGVFPQHFIPERKSSFRLLNAGSQLRKVAQGFRHITHNFDCRRITAVDMRRSCADMDDCFIQPGVKP